jgi:hypothetical protein
LPIFIGDDTKAMHDLARQNLGLYATFPFFQRLFRASGFAEEAAQMEKGAGAAALSERLLTRCACRDRSRAAGNSFPRFGLPARTSRFSCRPSASTARAG